MDAALVTRLRDARIGWSDLETFLHVVETGSFRGAVGPSGVSLNTLRMRVDRLEQQAGTALLARGIGGVVPTRAGQFVVAVGRAMAAAKAEMLAGSVR